MRRQAEHAGGQRNTASGEWRPVTGIVFTVEQANEESRTLQSSSSDDLRAAQYVHSTRVQYGRASRLQNREQKRKEDEDKENILLSVNNKKGASRGPGGRLTTMELIVQSTKVLFFFCVISRSSGPY